MHSSSYIQSIFSFFKALDIVNLRLHLKDQYTYQETTKDIFLDKVESLFLELKNCGDTALSVYEGSCSDKRCNNCSKNGFRFVGNISGNYFDLIFVVEGDDITNIFNCEEFETHFQTENLPLALVSRRVPPLTYPFIPRHPSSSSPPMQIGNLHVFNHGSVIHLLFSFCHLYFPTTGFLFISSFVIVYRLLSR